jgi:hypothetical protein
LRPRNRRALITGALCLVTTGAAVAPAAAQDETGGTYPTASVAKVGVAKAKLDVRAGRRARVSGSLAVAGDPALYTAALQVRLGGRWRTLDRDRADASGAYELRRRVRAPMSRKVRVRVRGPEDGAKRRVGRLNVYRLAYASWYGPGLYGNRLACGGRLGYDTIGVAHKTLPCGARLTLRHRGRSVRVRVIDRGPYVGGREFDLTAATARRLGFRGHGYVLSTR